MSTLPAVITLHDVEDVEAFARSILNDHLAVGARTKNGYTGHTSLSPHDFEICVNDLVSCAWEIAAKFDGRGRFSGFLAMMLHYEVTNWKRRYYGSTRYNRPTVELTDDERDLVATVVDFTGPEVLDLVRLIDEPHKSTLERIVIPIFIHGEKTIEDYAGESGIQPKDIHAKIRRLGHHLQERELLAA